MEGINTGWSPRPAPVKPLRSFPLQTNSRGQQVARSVLELPEEARPVAREIHVIFQDPNVRSRACQNTGDEKRVGKPVLDSSIFKHLPAARRQDIRGGCNRQIDSRIREVALVDHEVPVNQPSGLFDQTIEVILNPGTRHMGQKESRLANGFRFRASKESKHRSRE